MTTEQMRGLADDRRALGGGDIRLTVWQNLLISDIEPSNAERSSGARGARASTAKASSVRAGLIACTGNTGCKFARSNTKGTPMAIADRLDPRVAARPAHQHPPDRLPAFVRQHYIGDIGLLAAKVAVGDERGHGRRLSPLRRRRLRRGRGDRPRDLPRREGRGLPAR